MLRRILNFYRFTISEQKSLVLLCVLLVCINGINYFMRNDPNESISFIPDSGDLPGQNDQTNKAVAGQPKEGELLYKQIVQKPVLEINTSDSAAFLSLYGIGPVFAGRIVKYRALLGGYYSCDQLLEVYGMDSIRYMGFRKNIRVDTAGLKRLNINTCGFKDLLRHPYLDYDAVRLLVQYRDKKGPISSPLDLWRDSILSGDIRSKLSPYLKSR